MLEKQGIVSINDSSGKLKIKIEVEIAETEMDMQIGLMFRRKMEEDHGMLFIFPEVKVHSFWMVNTFIPLDIILINSKKEIVSIYKNVQPLTDRPMPVSGLSKFGLEVNAGFSDKYDIKPGDKVSF